MKKRYLSLLLFSASLTLTSCSFFTFITERLTSIEIADANSSYLVGQKYSSDNSLTITGHFSDDSTKTFTLSEVTPTLTCSDTSYSVTKAFTVAGEYSLFVTKDNVKSNTINFTVFEDTQYVTSMSVSGEHTMYTNNITNLSVTVAPTYFTVPVTATSSNADIAKVTKTSKTEFTVSALAAGEVDITFKALRNETEYLQVEHHISISTKTTVDMAYTYADVKRNNYYNTPGFPLSGNQHMLVVPVWFTDSSSYIKASYKQTVIEDIRKAYFGSKEDTGWHSVATFYNEESSNRLTLDGTVTGWWECGLSATTVGGYTNSNSLAVDAADWFFDGTPEHPRSYYDGNNDGYIDSIMLIYAAPDQTVIKSFGENMWAYCFWVQDSSQRSTTNPGVNTYFWASYDFMYGSNLAYSHTGNTYSNGDTSHCKIDAHTYIHEMGHVFGLDDYYDYTPGENRLNPAGGFSMQDNNVGGHEAFSMTAFGWSNVYIPTESCELTLSDFQTSKQVIILSPSWNSNDSPFDEYMLLELYAPTGLNEMDSSYQYQNRYPLGPSDVGIRLWHVDARLFRNGSFTTNASLSGIRLGLNNTSTTDDQGGRTCSAGASYQEYNLLQLIRNDTNATRQSKDNLKGTDLFKQGSSYSQSTFANQFPRGNTLNTGSTLGWSFTVNSILQDDGVYKAIIRFTKA